MWGDMTRSITAMAMGLLLILLVGCGGSDSAPLTKAEYTKQAQAICHVGEHEKEEAVEAAMLKYQEGEKNATSKLQEEAIVEVLAPYERTTAKLMELEPPAELEKKVETMLRLRVAAPKVMKADPKKALQSSNAINKAVKGTEALGLGSCDL
jgi:hypothetical protein